MGRLLDLIFGVFFLIGIVFLGVIGYQELGEKRIQGYVYDCLTREPVEGADIRLEQASALTLDNIYHFYGTTTRSGIFSVTFNRGSMAHIFASKEGYLTAEAWSDPKKVPKVWLLPRVAEDGPNELSYGCLPARECYINEEVILNGKKTIRRNQCEPNATTQ